MFAQYQTNIMELQSRQAQEQTRIYTGKRIVNLADDPKAVQNIQIFSESISKAEMYQRNIEEALDEQTSTESSLSYIADRADEVRQIGIDANQIANFDKLPVLGAQVKTLLQSMVDKANEQHNGVYIFSGTKTSAASLQPTAPEQLAQPFEIVQDTPSATNPSGLRVTFKGNNAARSINVGPNTTETINSTAEDSFGTGGVQLFNQVIDLYNNLMYKTDGTRRADGEKPAPEEYTKLQTQVQSIANSIDTVNGETARLASRSLRFESLRDQYDEDIIRTKEFRSSEEDTDVAKSIMQLQKDEQSLNYALQVGSRILSKSLLDFLG